MGMPGGSGTSGCDAEHLSRIPSPQVGIDIYHKPEDKDPRSWHLHLQVTSTQALSRVDMSARNDQWPQT